MEIYFINPPFKAEFGKFSRESRSPAITKSGALYYPLWLIYAALYSEKNGHKIHFLDAHMMCQTDLPPTIPVRFFLENPIRDINQKRDIGITHMKWGKQWI